MAKLTLIGAGGHQLYLEGGTIRLKPGPRGGYLVISDSPQPTGISLEPPPPPPPPPPKFPLPDINVEVYVGHPPDIDLGEFKGAVEVRSIAELAGPKFATLRGTGGVTIGRLQAARTVEIADVANAWRSLAGDVDWTLMVMPSDG